MYINYKPTRAAIYGEILIHKRIANLVMYDNLFHALGFYHII